MNWDPSLRLRLPPTPVARGTWPGELVNAWMSGWVNAEKQEKLKVKMKSAKPKLKMQNYPKGITLRNPTGQAHGAGILKIKNEDWGLNEGLSSATEVSFCSFGRFLDSATLRSKWQRFGLARRRMGGWVNGWMRGWLLNIPSTTLRINSQGILHKEVV